MASDDEVMNNISDIEDDDLFGDEVEEQEPEPEPKPRELSDEELDSGDDDGRDDRLPEKEAIEEHDEPTRNARILMADIYRHPIPKPADGELTTLRLPKFLGIEPRAYDPNTFEIPVSDHHVTTQSANFSANAVAASTIRHRKTAAGKLESNTVLCRWSDGSASLAIGDHHYVLQTKPLAPSKESKTYNEVQDSHYYMASPSVFSQILVLVGHMRNEYTVRPNKDNEDDALEKLRKNLAAATRGNLKGDEKGGPEMIMSTQDPELQKKRAELAEKERMRAQRRRETQAEKANIPVGGRRPLAGGLNIDDLEGRSGRRAPAGRKSGGPKRPRRRPEYDSDDDLPRGHNREDEYDKEDDFLASSDEELEVGDDDEEEEILDESEDEAPRAKKQKVSKPEEASDADADAEADLDDDDAIQAPHAEPSGGNRRKRNIIEDDDDE